MSPSGEKLIASIRNSVKLARELAESSKLVGLTKIAAKASELEAAHLDCIAAVEEVERIQNEIHEMIIGATP